MTEKEKAIIAKEKKQLQVFIDDLRKESNAIGKRLASMIVTIGSARASQLGIDLTLRELEAKLKPSEK